MENRESPSTDDLGHYGGTRQTRQTQNLLEKSVGVRFPLVAPISFAIYALCGIFMVGSLNGDVGEWLKPAVLKTVAP